MEFGVEEGFKTGKGEFILKRKDECLIIQDGTGKTQKYFISIPYPASLALSEINVIGYNNGQICMLGTKGGKCLVMSGYNKPIVDAEIRYTSFK